MRPGRSSIANAGRVVCVVVAALLLNACGFHLRGAAPLPAEMSVTYIQGAGKFDSLNNAFRTALESHGARVTADRGEATAVLTILENKTDTTVMTVDLSGKVREYRLSQNIQFEVMTADGHMLVDRQSVMLNRVINFDRKALLGAEGERDMVRSELQRDVVHLAMLRIVAAGKR
jgi:LPS-assembly lipoprotein